jgi:hypothetical protein
LPRAIADEELTLWLQKCLYNDLNFMACLYQRSSIIARKPENTAAAAQNFNAMLWRLAPLTFLTSQVRNRENCVAAALNSHFLSIFVTW